MPSVMLTDEQKVELVKQHDRGVSIAELRRRFDGVSTYMVKQIVEEAKTPKTLTRSQKAEQVNKKLIEIKAFTKYQQGYSPAKLATMADTSPAYVKKWLSNKRDTMI